MFRKVDVPILGLVENMSYFKCSACGHVEHIFGHAGARQTAEEMGLPFLGEIPLHSAIRQLSDDGTPVVAMQPDSELSAPYLSLARAVIEKLDAKKPTPVISME